MVAILLADGFEEAEALVTADLLRRGGCQTALVGVSGSSVTGSHRMVVAADLTLDRLSPETLEMLVLPGGLGGVQGIQASAAALKLIQAAAGRGIPVAAICAAPTILAGLGLLEGRRAVCYPGMEDQMAGAVMVPGAPVVEDGPFLTGQAAGACFDFGLALVARLRGADAAERVRREVHYRD
jgi:4-methyl-5(b-hydroxyethyl)-thiazole monophosphate biosynthesis